MSFPKRASFLGAFAVFSLSTTCLTGQVPADWPAGYPEWWYNAEDPANGVINATLPAFNQNNFALLNQGQLWNLADQAIQELDTQLATVGGANFSLEDFSNDTSPIYHAPANIGQLKHVSSHFFDRFAQVGFTPESSGWPDTLILNTGPEDQAPNYPWLQNVTPSNANIANIGQAKHLFSWDLSLFIENTPPEAPSELNIFYIDDNTLTLTWQDNSDNEDGFIIYGQTNSGNWEEVDRVAVDQTSYTISSAPSPLALYSNYSVSAYRTSSSGNESSNPPGSGGNNVAKPEPPTKILIEFVEKTKSVVFNPYPPQSIEFDSSQPDDIKINYTEDDYSQYLYDQKDIAEGVLNINYSNTNSSLIIQKDYTISTESLRKFLIYENGESVTVTETSNDENSFDETDNSSSEYAFKLLRGDTESLMDEVDNYSYYARNHDTYLFNLSGSPASFICLYKNLVKKDFTHEETSSDGFTFVYGTYSEYVPEEGEDGEEMPEKVIVIKWTGKEILIDGVEKPQGFNLYDIFEGNVEGRLLKVDLAVDADRSGTENDPGIQFGGSDQTTQNEPYRFWVNNDLDYGNEDEAEDREPIGAPDHLDGQIDFARDLEDFSRLWIDVGGLSEQLKNGDLRLGFKWQNVKEGTPGIKLYRAVETDGGLKYLTDENVANQQKAPPTYGYAIAFNTGNFGGPPDAQVVDPSEPVYFETSFWSDLPADGIEHFIFEGVTEGKGELVFVLQSSTAGAYQDIDISMSGVWFELLDVKDMYQHFTVGDSIDTDPASSASEINGVSKADLDNLDLEDDYILFVHGWRMFPWERRYFAETAFKRLYWQGYKGRFGTFSWPTEWTSRPIGTAITDTENYMRSDEKAMHSGQGLAGTMNTLMGHYNGNLKIFAHSMGNVVVSEALRQGGQANTYVACQSASVARAYDTSGPERLTSSRLADALPAGSAFSVFLDDHPDVFAQHPPSGDVYYNGIKGNSPRIINHHNREDDALAWWLAGQAKKPNGDYYYESDEDRWYLDDAIWPIPDTALFFPGDRFSILARAAEPDSVPLGASVTNGHATAGEITGNTNLNTMFNFSNGAEDHSAQFRSTIQLRWDYWTQLLRDFGLAN